MNLRTGNPKVGDDVRSCGLDGIVIFNWCYRNSLGGCGPDSAGLE